jgi:hypothetical protein
MMSERKKKMQTGDQANNIEKWLFQTCQKYNLENFHYTKTHPEIYVWISTHYHEDLSLLVPELEVSGRNPTRAT